MRKKISIITPTYNEEENIKFLYAEIKNIIGKIDRYDFEIVIIDNASTDGTVDILKDIAAHDSSVKVILNTRNFGHIRSPYWGIMQTTGDATIYLASDFQDPPIKIPQFIEEWERGWKIVLGVKPTSVSKSFFNKIRRLYYKLLDEIAEIDIIRDTTGFGLYDKQVLDHIRKIYDPYPFLRGLICELGYPIKTLEFIQPNRDRGISKNNFYTLYDIAVLGLISHSNIPLRISSFIGYIIAGISFLLAIGYFLLKIFNWYDFPRGVAPIIISMFIFFSLLFVFVGILGEYVSIIYTHIRNRPIVVERERINF
ncbi:glycosyltransferase family 2 protein [Polynucleobacter paneuropaeus]|nr:glycosyltransferase family 2 protein [Polynucleobacter paneuropaeus]